MEREIDNVEMLVMQGDLEREIGPSLAVAREIVVKDSESYELAGKLVKDLTSLEKRVKEFWAPEKEMAAKLHKSIVAKEKSMLAPIEDEKSAKIRSMKEWAEAQAVLKQRAQAVSGSDIEFAGNSVPSGYGNFLRKTWKAEVYDVKALMQAALDGKVPAQVVIPDAQFLNAQARLLKGLMQYPGVRVVES